MSHVTVIRQVKGIMCDADDLFIFATISVNKDEYLLSSYLIYIFNYLFVFYVF